MAILFGREHSRGDLERRVGHLSQVAGIRLMQLQEGAETGARVADVRSGSGLRFHVSLDRGMDISLAEYKGIPLAWRSPAGDVHPGFYDSKGMGWLKSFPGGLMTGCGLTYAGAPCVDEGEELGIHGRLSNTPAVDISSIATWKDDHCVFSVSGKIREQELFKHNLLLSRTIEVGLGESVITIRDAVDNEGSQRSPLMMLYHVNLGWPLLDKGAEVLINARSTKARDAEAEKGLSEAVNIPAPVHGYKEQVFYHDVVADKTGYAVVVLRNRTLGLNLFVRYRQKELPRFIQWKMVGEGEYVLGFEPANCLVEGRAKERGRGTLQFLEPGERREFYLQIGVLEGDVSIDQINHAANRR